MWACSKATPSESMDGSTIGTSMGRGRCSAIQCFGYAHRLPLTSQEALNRCLAAKCSCSQCRRHEKVLVIIIPLIEAPAILQDRTQPSRTIGLLWHKQAIRLGMIIIGGTEGAFYQIAQTHLHAMCTCVLAQILKLSSPATGSFQSDPSWNSGRVCKVDLYPSSSQFVYFLS